MTNLAPNLDHLLPRRVVIAPIRFVLMSVEERKMWKGKKKGDVFIRLIGHARFLHFVW